MPQFDERHVKLEGGVVVWDGVTNPETQTNGANAGSPKWSLRAVFPPECADLQLFDQLAQATLAQSKWRGQLPADGKMPIRQTKPGEFKDMFPGWYVIAFKTQYMPDVYDENGGRIDPMQLNQLLYTGQRVDVLAHCYPYDAAGNKGISAGLDAFGIIASANAQVLQLGNGPDMSSAFGGGAPAQGQQPQGGQPYGAPAQGPTASRRSAIRLTGPRPPASRRSAIRRTGPRPPAIRRTATVHRLPATVNPPAAHGRRN